MKRRKFTREFKIEILRELEGKTLAQVCREHDLLPMLSANGEKIMRAIPLRHSAEMENYGKSLQKLRNTRGL